VRLKQISGTVTIDNTLRDALLKPRSIAAVFLAPRAEGALVQLQQSGVAGFRTPESCADAVDGLVVFEENP
jgi:hypothetical protein